MDTRIERVMDRLRRNNINPVFVPTRAEVLPQVEQLLRSGDTVAVGGSETLKETGVLELLRGGNYRFIDRFAPGLSQEEIRDCFVQAFGADAFLCSANAITENGELYNVDGNGNRIAALCYGPQSVIVVVGVNKIVRDIPEAIRRVKTVAAPRNAVRLNCETYCAHAGRCQGLDGDMTDGCSSRGRICSTYMVIGFQRNIGRIKVILVGEECGY